MTTTPDFELTEKLTGNGFTFERYSYNEEYPEIPSNLHFDVTKPENAALKGHVEIDAEGNVVEAFVEVLDENGNSYSNRNMSVFLEDADCKSIEAVTARLVHVFS